MSMKLLKIISDKKYKDKNGVEHYQTNFYIETETGARICIKPAFVEDIKALNVIAELVDNRKQIKESK